MSKLFRAANQAWDGLKAAGRIIAGMLKTLSLRRRLGRATYAIGEFVLSQRVTMPGKQSEIANALSLLEQTQTMRQEIKRQSWELWQNKIGLTVVGGVVLLLSIAGLLAIGGIVADVIPPGRDASSRIEGAAWSRRSGQSSASEHSAETSKASPDTRKLSFSSIRQPVHSLTFSPTGKYLFATFHEYEENIQSKGSLFDVAGWREMKPDSHGCDYFGAPAVFSPDGDFLACLDGELIRVWNLKSEPIRLANTVQGWGVRQNLRGTAIDVLAWTDDGTLVARGVDGGLQFLQQDAQKGAVLISSIAGGEIRQEDTFRLDGRIYSSLAVSSAGHCFAVSGSGGCALYTIPGGQLIWSMPDVYFQLAGLSPDGAFLVGSRTGIDVSVWPMSSPPHRTDLDLDERDVNPSGIGTTALTFRCFSPNGKMYATSASIRVQTADGDKVRRVVTIWDTSSAKRQLQVDATDTGVVFFSRDGSTIVAGGKGFVYGPDVDLSSLNGMTSVDFWDITTGENCFHITDNAISTLALSPNRKVLLTGYFGDRSDQFVGENKDCRAFFGERKIPVRVWPVK